MSEVVAALDRIGFQLGRIADLLNEIWSAAGAFIESIEQDER